MAASTRFTMYGRPISETVGLLDMYTDMNVGEPDRE